MTLMPSGHGHPVSFSFAGLQYAELLISGQSLGSCLGWERIDPICIQSVTSWKCWGVGVYSLTAVLE